MANESDNDKKVDSRIRKPPTEPDNYPSPVVASNTGPAIEGAGHVSNTANRGSIGESRESPLRPNTLNEAMLVRRHERPTDTQRRGLSAIRSLELSQRPCIPTAPISAHRDPVENPIKSSPPQLPPRSEERKRLFLKEQRDRRRNEEARYVYETNTDCETVLTSAMSKHKHKKAFMYMYNNPQISDQIDLCFKNRIDSNVQKAVILPDYNTGLYLYNKAVPIEIEIESLLVLQFMLFDNECIFDHRQKDVLKPYKYVGRYLPSEHGPPDTSRITSDYRSAFYEPLIEEVDIQGKRGCEKAFAEMIKEKGNLISGSFLYARFPMSTTINLCYWVKEGHILYAVITEHDDDKGKKSVKYMAARPQLDTPGIMEVVEKRSISDLTNGFENDHEYVFDDQNKHVGFKPRVMDPRHFIPKP